jgi:hypothetical protein
VLPRARIKRGRGGGIRLRLPDDERELLELLCEELRGRVDEEPDHPDLRRLFPRAHADDPEAEAAYRALVGSQLDVGRERAIATVQGTLGNDTLSTDEAESWLRVLNDLRLVLGTRLDVSEETDLDVDPGDPDAGAYGLYGYLGWLLELLVDAAAT